MDHREDRKTVRSNDAVAGPVEIACRIAGTGEIQAVHVVWSRRPAYDELLHSRRLAEVLDLELTVAASSVSVRPRLHLHPAREGDEATWLELGVDRARRWRTVLTEALAHEVTSLRVHARNWSAGLATLSEGTR